jgi:hypothetical protein
LILPIFVEEQRELLWQRIDLWQRHNESGMSKDKYLEMQEQLGREPDIEKCPPGIEDMPDVFLDAINIYNSLGDRIYPEIGYIGKDFTNLPILLGVYKIDNIDLLMEILSRLDGHAIKKSSEHLKREYDKLKRK